MNQNTTQETSKQSWINRSVTAVFNQFFDAFSYHATAVTPHETQMFRNDISYGCEYSMMAQQNSWLHFKMDEEI